MAFMFRALILVLVGIVVGAVIRPVQAQTESPIFKAELAGIDNPVAGTWIAIVNGFSISSRSGDKFGLRLVADGKVIKVK